MLLFLIIFGLLATLLNGIHSLVGCGTLIKDRCPNEDVTFWLYNRNLKLPYKFNEASLDSIKNAPFNNSTIKILVHGYDGNKSTQINKYLRPEYLKLDYNVISLDYGPATKFPCYVETVKNARIISKCFTKFLLTLLKTQNRYRKITTEDIHVLGFSMGAQISGKTGMVLSKRYSRTIQRLTGLDAALPLYPLSFSKISAQSAKFVDAIHTDGGVLGKFTTIGTADFFCNINPVQPGCNPIDPVCNHFRSLKYFAESIQKRNKKFCGRRPLTRNAEMGERVPTSAKGVYKVYTKFKPPYAIDSTWDC